jgi:uncharacterized membrane protein
MAYSWFYLSLIAAVIAGVQTVITKIALNKGLSSSVIAAYIFSITAVFLWTYLFLRESVVLPNREIAILLIIISAMALVLNLVIFKALQIANNPGNVQAVSALGILVTFIISLIVLNLKFDLYSAAGIALVVLGTVLLSRAI